MKEALFYDKLDSKKVKCFLCGQNCLIAEGKSGFCAVRRNIEGVLYSLVYGKVISAAVDPIEKKPLYHFYPGEQAYSVATVGCNFSCLNCQNADISQLPAGGLKITGAEVAPADIVRQAQALEARIIAYTYTEPTIFYELAFDTARLASQSGLKNVFVTNGYMSGKPLEKISDYLDAANVDLKFFDDKKYQKVCSAHLEPVLETIRRMHKLGIWLEVTTLVIPGLNDDEEQLSGIAGFLAAIDKNIPWHLSAFYPTYKLKDHEATSAEILYKARDIAKAAGLKFIYCGNIHDGQTQNTNCPSCGRLLIRRTGYSLADYNIENGKCAFCQAEVAGEGMQS